MSIFEFIKNFYRWAEENPEKVKPYHWAIYMVAVEKCNQLGWKKKFGFPTYNTLEITGISSRRTYYKGLSQLVEFGFLKIVQKARNQHQSAVVSLVNCQSKNDISEASAVQQHDTDTAPILRLNKTIKDFKEYKNNKEILKIFISENSELLDFISSKTTLKDAEKEKRIDDFLAEKFSSGENQKWQNEIQFFTHFRNWFLKKNSDKKIENNPKKAERR